MFCRTRTAKLASLPRAVPGGWQAALTKPWRVGTARRRGYSERDGKAYARNRRFYASQRRTGSNLANLGRRRRAPGSLITGAGNSPVATNRGANTAGSDGWTVTRIEHELGRSVFLDDLRANQGRAVPTQSARSSSPLLAESRQV